MNAQTLHSMLNQETLRPQADEGRRPSGPFQPLGEGRYVSLLLFVPRSPLSILLNELSGGYGYSHLAVDLGEVDVATGARVMVEADLDGVHYTFQDRYGQRAFVRIPLAPAGVDPEPFCAAIRARVGEPYDYGEIFTLGGVDNPARQICSNLAAICLPRWMQADLVRHLQAGLIHPLSAVVRGSPDGDFHLFVSPNGFAEYFGAPRGQALTGPEQRHDPALPDEPTSPRRHQLAAGLWPYGLLALIALSSAILGTVFLARNQSNRLAGRLSR